MPFSATVLPVMIASPGDVHEYRAHARDVIHEWNYIHSASTNAVLMPVGWETHSSPELGSSAQELINDRVLEDCDLLVGIFWTRLGTPTERALSGTVEEIQLHVKAGKPAMVYFSRAPAALETVDPAQYAALREFRTWCVSQGLIETFDNQSDFQTKLRRHLQITLQKSDYLKSILLRVASSQVDNPSLPQPGTEYEVATVAVTLSQEARSLLLGAAEDRSGTILAMNVMAGRLIQAGGKEFGNMGDRRSMARWDYGLEQLLTLGLVEEMSQGGKGDKVFQVVEWGYRVAEYFAQNPK